MIAALWGIFVWREFQNAPAGINKFIAAMMLAYTSGLVLIVLSKIVR